MHWFLHKSTNVLIYQYLPFFVFIFFHPLYSYFYWVLGGGTWTILVKPHNKQLMSFRWHLVYWYTIKIWRFADNPPMITITSEVGNVWGSADGFKKNLPQRQLIDIKYKTVSKCSEGFVNQRRVRWLGAFRLEAMCFQQAVIPSSDSMLSSPSCKQPSKQNTKSCPKGPLKGNPYSECLFNDVAFISHRLGWFWKLLIVQYCVKAYMDENGDIQ